MPKVRMFSVTMKEAIYAYYGDMEILTEGITEWEEVSEEEYQELRKYVNRYNSRKGNKTYLVVAYLHGKKFIARCLDDYRQMLIDDEKRIEEGKKRAKKAAATRKRKQEEQERKKFEELKAKYE